MRAISPNITTVSDIIETPILTPSEAGGWLNLSSGMITKQTQLLTDLILTTTEVVEKYLWIALRRTTFIAEYDLPSSDFYAFFAGTLKLGLQRAPILALADILKIEYLDENGVYVEYDRGVMTVEGLYENVTEKKEQREWASIYFDSNVPFDNSRINAYKIKITFTAGYTIDTAIETDIPQSLKTAMLMIIGYYYTNRGDCSDCGCDLNGYPVPCPAKGIIDQYSVAKTTIGGSYTPAEGCGGFF